ncbi:MAG: GNAT family N-acetyltransferase [Eggerthellaceae bacterium]|nr:GNAT family N-acetyltransferase [Eggerthellaceae bacterium]
MSTLLPNYQFVELTPALRGEIIDLKRWAFPCEVTRDEMLSVPDVIDYQRMMGVRHGPDQALVAMHSSFGWSQFKVPGATVSVAGLSTVAVHPEHRRKGLLNAIMNQHFAHCVQRNEAFSILVASEAVIYGRYGYGRAADCFSLSLSRGAALRPVEGSTEVSVRIIDLDAKKDAELIDRIHSEAGTQGVFARSGWATRNTSALKELMLTDYPSRLSGGEETRLMLAEREGRPVGYALFRRSDIWQSWAAGTPGSNVGVKEFVASDGAVAHALWSRLLDLDLTAKIGTAITAMDDPLLNLLVDVKAAEPKLEDLLWLRLIDVAQALTARQYAADVDVVLEVSDARLPANAGRWRLRAKAFSSEVQLLPTDVDADLRLDVRELGAAYLGGVSLAALAGAGLVGFESPEVLLRAASAFQWPIAPGCSWFF